MGKRLHVVIYTVFTNTCIRVVVFLMMSPNIVNKSSIIHTILSIIYWTKFYPVSNGIIIATNIPYL